LTGFTSTSLRVIGNFQKRILISSTLSGFQRGGEFRPETSRQQATGLLRAELVHSAFNLYQQENIDATENHTSAARVGGADVAGSGLETGPRRPLQPFNSRIFPAG
jgi:hypothetical protein